MGMVSSEGEAKSVIARKGDRRCRRVDVFCYGVLVLLWLCVRVANDSERREIFLLVRRDARVCYISVRCVEV